MSRQAGSAERPARASTTIPAQNPCRRGDEGPRAPAKAGAQFGGQDWAPAFAGARSRSEEHTSELQSLMRISYAVFCLKKKNIHKQPIYNNNNSNTHKLQSIN